MQYTPLKRKPEIGDWLLYKPFPDYHCEYLANEVIEGEFVILSYDDVWTRDNRLLVLNKTAIDLHTLGLVLLYRNRVITVRENSMSEFIREGLVTIMHAMKKSKENVQMLQAPIKLGSLVHFRRDLQSQSTSAQQAELYLIFEMARFSTDEVPVYKCFRPSAPQAKYYVTANEVEVVA